MRDYKKLQIWSRSHELALAVYKITAHFPKEEMFGLTNQMRRAAVSVPSNIAEGCGRESEAELRRFLEIASGSISELSYQLQLSQDLGYIDSVEGISVRDTASQTQRMLCAFITRLKKSQKHTSSQRKAKS